MLEVMLLRKTNEGPSFILRIYPRTSTHVRASDSLFNELGQTAGSAISLKDTDGNAGPDASKNMNYKYIDTLINVVGITTGYSIDIPVRIVKWTSNA